MPTINRTVTTSTDPQTVFAYLADFTNATEWDSGTESCTRTSGDGGVGTVYRNVSRFAGRKVELDYTVKVLAEPTFVIEGSTGSTTSLDTIVVRPHAGGGSEVDYTAEFTFGGIVKLFTPVMVPMLQKLGNDTAATLKTALDRLGRASA